MSMKKIMQKPMSDKAKKYSIVAGAVIASAAVTAHVMRKNAEKT